MHFYLCRQNDFHKKPGSSCNHFMCHMLFYNLWWKTNDVSTFLHTGWLLLLLRTWWFVCVWVWVLSLLLNPLAKLAKLCPLETAIKISDTLSSHIFFENRQLSRGRKIVWIFSYYSKWVSYISWGSIHVSIFCTVPQSSWNSHLDTNIDQMRHKSTGNHASLALVFTENCL